MWSWSPHSGFHHYTAALCNALVKQAGVKAVQYCCVMREQRVFGVGSEEHDLVEPVVQTAYLAPAGHHPWFRKYRLFLCNLRRFAMRLWSGNCDVLHLQTAMYSQVLSLLLMAWCRVSGVRIVRTVHEIHLRQRGRGLGRARRWLAHLELRLADHLVVHDTMTQAYLARVLGRRMQTLTAIPHGNYLRFRTYAPPDHDEDQVYRQEQTPCVLFFGIKRHKGLEVFMEAWRMLQAEGHACTAILAGMAHADDADLAEKARRLPGLEVQAGYISNAQLWRVFGRSTLVAMPYLSGMTSGSVHLAFAFKRPVIASDLACFQGLVIPGQTGLIVPRGDAIALKRAIVQLCLDRTLCRRMGQEGFRLVSAATYDWDEIASQTLRVYRQVCSHV